MDKILSTIEHYKLIPVVVANTLDDGDTILRALNDGGLKIAEITFRTACARDVIQLARDKYPDILVGAGTILNAQQCAEAIAVGAKFVVSPGFSKEVLNLCKEKNIFYLPGAVTPTEIMQVIAEGISLVKFFPAQVYGGIKAIKALSAAFSQIKFVPTGGVDANNLKEYLSFNKIFAIGGSFMIGKDYSNTLTLIQNALKIVNEGD